MSRDLITVRGPDAGTYLQGQLSQDVLALAVGASAPSLLLEPTGKLGWWFQVSRLSEDAFRLDVDAGFGDAVVARLERFKIRTDAEISLMPASAEQAGADQASADQAGEREHGDAREAARIVAGVPRLGAEIVDGVIPAELGRALVDRSVSFTKGCYTGQELVARVDARGDNVPRHLRRLEVSGGEVPPASAEIVVGDKVVGVVTSAARTADGAVVALGFVHRSVEVPAEVALRWEGGATSAHADPLPDDVPAS
jgi:folate-binding protein YgfZ